MYVYIVLYNYVLVVGNTIIKLVLSSVHTLFVKLGISIEMIASMLITLSVGHWKAYTKITALMNCLPIAMGTMIIVLQVIVYACSTDLL